MSSNAQYDKKIFRLMSILGLLDSRKAVLTRDLSDQFNVSIRTVQRDIELLDMTGFPVVMLEKGAYAFADGFSLSKMKLNEREASLLVFFQEISLSLGSEFEKVFAQLMQKVTKTQDDAPFYIKMPQVNFAHADLTYWKDLEGAIAETFKVEINYDRSPTPKKYILCPLKLINYEGFWYLLALSEGDKTPKKFRLDKIKGVKTLDLQFDAPANLHAMLEESTSVWFAGKRDKKVTLKIDEQVSQFFKKKDYFPLQKIVKEHKDGSITLETMVGDFMEILPTIRHWLPHIHIISPITFKKDLIDSLKNYIKAT